MHVSAAVVCDYGLDLHLISIDIPSRAGEKVSWHIKRLHGDLIMRIARDLAQRRLSFENPTMIKDYIPQQPIILKQRKGQQLLVALQVMSIIFALIYLIARNVFV